MAYIGGIYEKNLDTNEVTKHYFADGRASPCAKARAYSISPTIIWVAPRLYSTPAGMSFRKRGTTPTAAFGLRA